MPFRGVEAQMHLLRDSKLLDDLNVDVAHLQRLLYVIHDWCSADGTGLQLAICVRGHLVLSAWDGVDQFSNDAIQRTTLFPILSATKGLASIVLLHLHHLGYFKWSSPISHYWPEFGSNGKREATIEQLLSHRVGLPGLTAPWERWVDRSYMTRLVEEAAPEWEPGSRYGYHGGSWGIIVDELIRRWTGATTGEILRNSFSQAVDAEDCYIGLPLECYPRVARLAFLEPEQRASTFRLGPLGPDGEYNNKHILASCQSSGGGVTSAEALARLYNFVAFQGQWSGTSYWLPDEQADASRSRNTLAEAPAARPGLAFAWGLGFMVSPSHDVFGSSPPSSATAGHPGASGAIGYADPPSQTTVALTINGIGGKHMYERYRLLGDCVQSAVRP
jgi:CubicO group peptidase (beta-lactamase class C family)